MNRDGKYGAQRLRERTPPWPRRNDDSDEPDRSRWERDPEPFEDGGVTELYPGALVMEDLTIGADDTATLRVLARYTVVRVLLPSVSGGLAGTALRLEQRIALEHVALLPPHDWERRALERLVMLCGESPRPPIIAGIIIAAEAAAKRSQVMGAFALYRTAYDIATSRHWWDGAALAARGVERLARLQEARHSVRLWERRAAVLERRAASGTGPPPPGDA